MRAYEPDRIVARWWCPVCGAAVHRLARPGRPRVYCTNACRQRAYRWRRDTRGEGTPDATEYVRGRTRERSHAMRRRRDFTATLADSAGRELTLCGAFARRATRPPWAHTRFVPEVPWSCHTCIDLLEPASSSADGRPRPDG